ncbi:dolichyl phosphate glucosyltransferase [Cryptosporidium felis]|nr:dolichyl phosphate glucosyltransferase [Cryptosporidium felis]
MLLLSGLVLVLALLVFGFTRQFRKGDNLTQERVRNAFLSRGFDLHKEATGNCEDTRLNLERSPEVYLSIVVPAFNEEERIWTTLNSMLDYMEERSRSDSTFRYEIILVDDGSSDNTLRVCEDLWLQKTSRGEVSGGRLRLLSYSENRGKGNAVRIGVLASLGEYILMADADGATKIECFSLLEEAMSGKDGQVEIVFGSRNMVLQGNDEYEEPQIKRIWYRQFLNSAFHKITQTVVGTELTDTQCGFKLFSRKSARAIFPSLHIKRWAFDIEIVLIAKILDLKIQQVSVSWREIHGSKLSVLSDSFRMLLDVIILRTLYLLGIWKIGDLQSLGSGEKAPSMHSVSTIDNMKSKKTC